MLDRVCPPSLTSIGAFEAAARQGSFAKAARELGTSPAAVSYHVRQLERLVDVPLFRRLPHRVELTNAGAIIAQDAALAFKLLRESFARVADDVQARLRITTLPTLGASWLTPKLGRFRNEFANVSVELDLSVQSRDVSSGEFDVGIRHGRGNWPGLEAVRLFPCIFTPLCSPALKDRVIRTEGLNWQTSTPLLGRPDWWDIWFKAIGHEAGPDPNRFALGLSAEHLDIAAAIEGHGVAIGSPILFASEIAAGRLSTLHDVEAGDGQAFWLVYSRARRSTPKVQAFREWLLNEIERALPT